MKVNIKKAVKYVFLVVIAVLGTTATTAQSVQKIGTNPTAISASAALEIESTDKGFLPPRMSTAQRNAITSPTVGLLIYNTTTNCLEHFGTSGWYNRCSGTMVSGTIDASSGGTAVVASWTSTLGCRVGAANNGNPAGVRQGGVNQTMVQNTSATGVATITLVADVTTAGNYNITTTTVNGVSFSASGNFVGTGLQTVILTANGTPTFAGNYIWVLNQTTATASLKNIYGSVLTTNAPLGSSYNAHFNGIISGVNNTSDLVTQTTGETFNNNTTCQNLPISAQGCAGVTTVTTSSGRVHNTVSINGQCWLQTSLIEVPSVYSGYSVYGQISWGNVYWPGDQGYWGYFSTANVYGGSGWGPSEPLNTNGTISYEGLLYQWCGAMNGTISERSRGICPAGWHIPSTCEWMYLEHGMGMSISSQNRGNGVRGGGTTESNLGKPGTKLLNYQLGNSATNASGFALLFAGTRFQEPEPYYGLVFYYRGFTAWIWTSSFVDADRAIYYYLHQSYVGIVRMNTPMASSNPSKGQANSVRCLKD